MTGPIAPVPDDDACVVRAVLGGDVSAYARLYDRHARLVRAICFDATGDLCHAQDLSQETFFRAYRRLSGLRDPSRFAAWLVGIARLVCKEWRRGRLRDRHLYVGLCSTVAADPPGGAERDQAARAEGLGQAMRALPERERLALHVFYLQDQSVEQARAVLGLSRSGFYRVLQRGRRRLGRLMQDHGKDTP